jgi:cation:H+ antiporter
MEHLELWAQFVGASAVIVFAGSRLTRYADILSDKLKLGHVFVGMIFLGWITSLPELVLSLGSTLAVGQPDLAIGNVLGSCLFNLLILVIADVIVIGGLIFTRTNPKSAITGLASLSMLLLATGGLVLGMIRGVPVGIESPFGLPLGLFSWLIVLFYISSTVFLYRYDKKSGVSVGEPVPTRYETVNMVYVGIASLAATVGIVGAGLWMSYLGDEIADKYVMTHSFVGTLFFAVVSSLPELTTTIASARLGFVDMCLGNIFGSNIFNIMIIAVSDIAYTESSIYSSPHTQGRAHLWVAIFAFAATVAVIWGVRRRTSRLLWRITWISLVVFLCYIAGLFMAQLL